MESNYRRGPRLTMVNGSDLSEQTRIIAKILNLYYMENCNQAAIAARLGLSAARVNRLLKTARQAGMVEINIRLPFRNLFDLENRLASVSGLEEVVVTPSIEDAQGGDLSMLAREAAGLLSSKIHPKERVCFGGGRTVSEIINYVAPRKISGVRIYPAIGGVQRDKDRDINSLATRLAQKLGGEAVQFYAPAFAETESERETFFCLTHVKKALEEARTAGVGLFGIGSLQIDSSIIQYCSIPYYKLAELVDQRNGVGEIIGYVIDSQGQDCIPELSKLVIGISLEEIRSIPVRIGAAAGSKKAPAIAAAIRGNFLTSLVVDESAAKQVLVILQEQLPIL
jgi:DNA-binding transcriptional regulator LsrR (DeoR family)